MSKKKPRPEPRPLKKADVVRLRMKAHGALTRVSRARLPVQAVIASELQAMLSRLQGATECVFLLSAKGTHVMLPLGSEAVLDERDVVVRCTFTLSPGAKLKDLQEIYVKITGAREKALRDVTRAVEKTRLPMAMQTR